MRPACHKIGFYGLVALTLCGCGSTPEELYPARGTVKVGDRLLDGGTIQAEMISVGESGKRYTAAGVVESDGTFELFTFGEPGAPVGTHRVWVIPDNARAPDKVGVNPALLSPIPRKYQMPTTTDIEIEIEPSDNNLEIVIPGK